MSDGQEFDENGNPVNMEYENCPSCQSDHWHNIGWNSYCESCDYTPWKALRQQISSLQKQLAEKDWELSDHEKSFDLRWEADMRAIKQWQVAYPGNTLVWPDHTDLCVWLMVELTAFREENAKLRTCLDESATVLTRAMVTIPNKATGLLKLVEDQRISIGQLLKEGE